jgi:hypothetical protein
MSDRGKRGPLSATITGEWQELCKSPPEAALKMVSPLKRKIRFGLNHATKAHKKAKTIYGSLATVDALPWKTLSHTGGFGNADDGILELEEVDNVQVVYEETPEGKVATFRVCYPRCKARARPE